MTTQQQEQQPEFLQKHRSKRPSWRRWLIVSIILLIMVVGIIIWILTSRNALTAILPIAIFTVLGVLIALFQWLFPISSSVSEHPSAHQHTHEVPPIIIHVPSMEPLHEPTSLPEKVSYRGIVGLPPPTDPRTIQQREHVVREVYTKLIQPDITAIALTGIGGVGKSTLAALIYRYVEEQRQTHTCPFLTETLWFTIDPAVTFADLAGNLFEALGKPFLDLNNLAPQNQAVALFNALNTTDKPRLVIVDQFENLLDWDTGHALTDRPGVGEWLDMLNSQKCNCRVLLTSRPRPVGTREYPPTYLQEFSVRGLELEEGIKLLLNQGVQGTNEELQVAVSYCSGHAFSLTLLASLLHDHHLDLTALFKQASLWTGDIAIYLLDQIYTQQLTIVQRELLLAFSVYRESVLLDAALAVITKPQNSQIQLALRTLLTQHLLEAIGGGRYQLHAIVADYALSRFDESKEYSNNDSLQSAHDRAAKYYVKRAETTCPPREMRRGVNDVHDLVEVIWQYCQSNEWQEAYNITKQEEIFSDLKLWGANATLLELCQLMLPLTKILPKSLETICIFEYMGRVYRTLGQRELALDYLEKALIICQEVGDRKGEGTMHSFLGSVYSDIGKLKQALKHLELALVIRREIGDYEGEGWTLNNLGYIYSFLGQESLALHYLEKSLVIHSEVGNRRGEERTLNNLGRVYDKLGQKERARSYYEQALIICREIGDLVGEGRTLNFLGLFDSDRGEYQHALKYYMLALEIFREVIDRGGEVRTLNNLGKVYRLLGQLEEAQKYLEQALNVSLEIGDRVEESVVLNNLAIVYSNQKLNEQALRHLERALSISIDVGDRSGEGWAQHNLGRVCTDLGQNEKALEHYKKALLIQREIGERSGEGWTLYNIGLLFLGDHYFRFALAFLLISKLIFEHDEEPDRGKVQSSIEALHELVGDVQFTALFATVDPQAAQIVDQALDGAKQFFS